MADEVRMARRTVSEISVTGLRIAARIGAHAHELDRRQTLGISATLTLRDDPGDVLAATADYSMVAALAEELAESHVTLIETFAERLAAACLALPNVAAAEILIEKPGALLNGVAGARVVLEWADD